MGMIDRYKKPGGFVQLLHLIETSQTKKQEQFLSLIGTESKAWEIEIRKKMLSIPKIFAWPSENLIEIITRLAPLTLAGALQGETPSLIDQVLANMSSFAKRKVTDLLQDIKSNPGEKFACQARIIVEVREFAHQGLIKFEKIDPELVIIPEIEMFLEKAHLMKADKSETNPKPLSFAIADDSTEPSAKNKNHHENHNSSASENEIRSLRQKVLLLNNDIQNLKQENAFLKEKLVQIKKIA